MNMKNAPSIYIKKFMTKISILNKNNPYPSFKIITKQNNATLLYGFAVLKNVPKWPVQNVIKFFKTKGNIKKSTNIKICGKCFGQLQTVIT